MCFTLISLAWAGGWVGCPSAPILFFEVAAPLSLPPLGRRGGGFYSDGPGNPFRRIMEGGQPTGRECIGQETG
jgi:hypothetical protein